jgi:small subunit ribosomal protein S20
LANTKSAEKRIRQNEKRRKRNQLFRSRARTLVRRTRELIDEGDLEQAQETARLAQKALDKAAERRVIHPNNAARRKSRLMDRLNAVLESQAAE